MRDVPVTLDRHAAGAAGHGVPPEVVALLDHLFREVLDLRNAVWTPAAVAPDARPPTRAGIV